MRCTPEGLLIALDPVASGGLGTVERRVRALQGVLQRLALTMLRDTDGNRDLTVRVVPDAVAQRYPLADTLGAFPSSVQSRLDQHQEELVSTVAADEVDGAQLIASDLGDGIAAPGRRPGARRCR